MQLRHDTLQSFPPGKLVEVIFNDNRESFKGKIIAGQEDTELSSRGTQEVRTIRFRVQPEGLKDEDEQNWPVREVATRDIADLQWV